MHAVVLKNDAVGDVVHSLKAIDNIIEDKSVKKVTIFLSKHSEKFIFFFNHPKVNIKILNYDLSALEKIRLFFFILTNKIDSVYILAPKNFYYFLPVFFIKIKFYAICINNINGYKRPSKFLRKFLYKYVINDRSATFKRRLTFEIQNELTSNNFTRDTKREIKIKMSDQLKKYLPKNYFYFHAKNERLRALGWGFAELKLILAELLKFCDHVVLTKDIGLDENTKIFKDNFNSFDFKTLKFNDKSQKIIFFDNIVGEDLYNVILKSSKIIAFHGMMTNLGSINKKKVLDLLFTFPLQNWNDYRNYRNRFYEFIQKYDGYDFTIPSRDIHKTIRKIKYSLKK